MGTAKDSGKELGFDYTITYDFDEAGQVKTFAIQAEPHETEAVIAAATAIIESSAQARQKYATLTASSNSQLIPVAAPASGPVPTFHQVVDGFLNDYDKAGSPSMFDKLKAAMPMLKAHVGDIPVTSIKQRHINDFFATLLRLPPEWKQECERLKLTMPQLAELEYPK